MALLPSLGMKRPRDFSPSLHIRHEPFALLCAVPGYPERRDALALGCVVAWVKAQELALLITHSLQVTW